MIELSGASVAVADTTGGRRIILHPLRLRLAEPRIALIGSNGSGKSTIARLLNGLIAPTTGRVGVTPPGAPRTLDTVRDGPAVRRSVGFVFTNPAAQLVMPTVLEDVALSLRRRFPRAREREAEARRALERFGISDLADRSVHDLSGGQQQLLALASVLATNPAVVVADEPTTLLDLRNSRMIADALCGLEQQLVIATHDLELAARCDRVLVIDGGRVVHDSASDAATLGAGAVDAAIDRYRSSQ